jgi:hypothetical protein
MVLLVWDERTLFALRVFFDIGILFVLSATILPIAFLIPIR